MKAFNYRTSIHNNLFRARLCSVTKVIMPRPPNVTKNNNVVAWRRSSAGGSMPYVSLAVTLSPGYYDASSMCNLLADSMQNADPSHAYSCQFEATTQNFVVTCNSVLPATNEAFYFIDTCSFIQRGKFNASFAGHPDNLDPTAVGAAVQVSGVAGLLYTRYVIVSSERLCQYSYCDSRVSTSTLSNNIIAVVEMTEAWEHGAVSPVAQGMLHTFRTDHSPVIMITNPQKNLDHNIDVYVQDEYGYPLDDAFDLGVSAGPNCLGISVWMNVSF
jgi:hypothetical protein